MPDRYSLDLMALHRADTAMDKAVEHLDDPQKARRYIRQAQARGRD